MPRFVECYALLAATSWEPGCAHCFSASCLGFTLAARLALRAAASASAKRLSYFEQQEQEAGQKT